MSVLLTPSGLVWESEFRLDLAEWVTCSQVLNFLKYFERDMRTDDSILWEQCEHVVGMLSVLVEVVGYKGNGHVVDKQVDEIVLIQAIVLFFVESFDLADGAMVGDKQGWVKLNSIHWYIPWKG